MKTKHILAVLSTCLIAVSFSPINFFSQAAPPPGFTMFDGKEFQFDVPNLTTGVWSPAFTCPSVGTMKITNARSMHIDTATASYDSRQSVLIKVTRYSSSQEIYFLYTNGIDLYSESSIMVSGGDTVEYWLDPSSYPTMVSASIIGVIS